MKKLSLLILLCCALSINASAQLCDYFNKSGLKTLARCAHPTDKFKSGSVKLNGQIATISINYTDGDHAKFSLKNRGYLIYSITTLEDDSSVEPFTALTIVKNVLSEVCLKLPSATKNKLIKEIETIVGKTIGKFSGKDYAALILTIGYYRYQKKV